MGIGGREVQAVVDGRVVIGDGVMGTAWLEKGGGQVDLLEARGKQLEATEERMAISVKADGSVYIGETQVELDEIAPELKAIAKNGYEEQIYVRGDQGVSYGVVLRVMGRINAGGFRKVSLVSEAEEGG